jgi:CheY-like chemotaxis protein
LGFTVSQVVHDYGDICQAVSELAIEQNAPITTDEFKTLMALAHDGPAALAAVATDCPDVGLLDIGLPGMSGYELAAKLRAGGLCPPSLKLVAVTGYAKDPEALAAAGFDGHLSKPVDFEQLGEMLASVIAGRGEPPRP